MCLACNMWFVFHERSGVATFEEQHRKRRTKCLEGEKGASTQRGMGVSCNCVLVCLERKTTENYLKF